MSERVLILYHHPLFAEAVRRLLSADADLDVRTAPLRGDTALAAVEQTRPAVVVVERPSSGEPEVALAPLLSRVPRIVSLGLADNSLTWVEGTSIAAAGPDDLRRAVRAAAAAEHAGADAGVTALRPTAVTWSLRWHGRGGQGVVTAAKILAAAAIRDGRHAQAFPEYGPERRGAPLAAFTRVADAPIRLFTAVERADVVVLLDPTLVGQVELLDGLKPGGLLLANWPESPEHLRAALGTRVHRLAAVDATALARDVLGQAIPNTVMLGALVRLVPVVAWPALDAELHATFGERGQDNARAARRGGEVGARAGC